MDQFDTARRLLKEFKDDGYLFGNGVLQDVGSMVASQGRRAVLVRGGFPGVETYLDTIRGSLKEAGVDLAAEIRGVRPNAPREDLVPLVQTLERENPDVVVSFAAGSTIDATKAAIVLLTLGSPIDDYFGVGLVTKRLEGSSHKLTPHVAIQTAASSGAHLTKYSNITDLATGQKKLIVDEAIVPSCSVFDYAVTHQSPPELTADGALDGFSHILEALL
jgi:alcohol dehydrogenase